MVVLSKTEASNAKMQPAPEDVGGSIGRSDEYRTKTYNMIVGDVPEYGGHNFLLLAGSASYAKENC